MSNMPTFAEPARQLSSRSDFDVIVCGGGPAGIGAALTAARQGARTLLLEVHGCLGGVWTAGNLSIALDPYDHHGNFKPLMGELDQRLKALGGGRVPVDGRKCLVYDPEVMKLVLERLCREAGVTVRLHTRVAAAYPEDGRLRTIVTESKSGREAWHSHVFIDCTGDGDLGAQAGCRFDMGHPDTGEVQPMSLTAILQGLDLDAVQPFLAGQRGRQPKVRFFEEIRRGGHELSTGIPLLLDIHDDLFAAMCTHNYGHDATDADSVTAATLDAREEAHRMVAALRSLGGPWSNLRIVSTGSQIGIREGRRIKGLYEVTIDDMLEGKRHEDGACDVNFGFDVHALKKSTDNGSIDKSLPKTGTMQPYQIPMRSLVARDVDGLLMAGRCVSGDFWAHSSYRVTGDAVQMGEATGRFAAQLARDRTTPHQALTKNFALT